jgi:hypothetical protein
MFLFVQMGVFVTMLRYKYTLILENHSGCLLFVHYDVFKKYSKNIKLYTLGVKIFHFKG